MLQSVSLLLLSQACRYYFRLGAKARRNAKRALRALCYNDTVVMRGAACSVAPEHLDSCRAGQLQLILVQEVLDCLLPERQSPTSDSYISGLCQKNWFFSP